LIYPLVAKRFKFFNLVQARKETFTEFLANLKSGVTLILCYVMLCCLILSAKFDDLKE
jgi:hypothetical protein